MRNLKIKTFVFGLALLSVLVVGCTAAKAMDVTKPNVTVSFSYASGLRYTPSYALWVEDEAGSRTTLYATDKAAGKGFDAKRPSALPVWYGIREDNADAVSAATPSDDQVNLRANLPEGMAGTKLKLFIEANASYDFNDYYREGMQKTDEGYSDVNGQPSVVWMAELDSTKVRGEAAAALVGTGDVLGADNKLLEDTSHITTAQDLLSSIAVSYDFISAK